MKPKQTLAQWLTFLEQLHPKGIDLGLERVAAVAEVLCLKNLNAKVITIAGTNGKGSTVATLEAGLSALKLNYGSYTSPHIHRFNERIKHNSHSVSDAELVACFEAIETARGDISLSYFEYTTLAALLSFQQAKLDVVLLEVGLGGRLDAVNIIDADIAIVTSIALDHQDWLGDSIDGIAKEKLGIARAARPLLIGERNPCDGLRLGGPNTGAQCLFIQQDFNIEIDSGQAQLSLVSGAKFTTSAPQNLSPESFVLAAQAMALLNYPLNTDVLNTMANSSLAGRFDVHQVNGKTVVFDVAHNPAAIARLCARINRVFAGKTVHVLLGVMADKNIDEMLLKLKSAINGQWFFSELSIPRAVPAGDLAQKVNEQLGINGQDSDIISALNRINEHEVLLICGSFYTVAAGMYSLELEGLTE